MFRTMCKSKIHGLKITQTKLHYQGSITIDEALLKKADILPGEKVEVLNFNNGSRIETYAIPGESNSGMVCLNGPAAHSGKAGDEIIVLSYSLVEEKKVKGYKHRIVYVRKNNRFKNLCLR